MNFSIVRSLDFEYDIHIIFNKGVNKWLREKIFIKY